MNCPDCYEFALNFLGEPEQTELRRYIEWLENRIEAQYAVRIPDDQQKVQADSLTLQEKQKLASERLRYIRLREIQGDYEIVIQFYNGGVRQIISRKDTAADVIGKLRYLAEMIKRYTVEWSAEDNNTK